MKKEQNSTETTDKTLHIGSVRERYPKDCILKYEDGWYITFKSLRGNIIKSKGPYKSKAMAEHDRRTLNAR